MTYGDIYLPNHGIVKLTELQYHSSWDWLIPVAAKLKDPRLCTNHTVVFVARISKSLLSTTLSEVYEAVTNFISYLQEKEEREQQQIESLVELIKRSGISSKLAQAEKAQIAEMQTSTIEAVFSYSLN